MQQYLKKNIYIVYRIDNFGGNMEQFSINTIFCKKIDLTSKTLNLKLCNSLSSGGIDIINFNRKGEIIPHSVI